MGSTTVTLAETYRPVRLAELIDQPIEDIQLLLDGRNTPNFLLYGPPGTGKTTAARCIAHELQQDTTSYTELNASDDRGIDTVRQTINRAANQLTLSGSPPVIILDEMESMSSDAQKALKKPMEDAPGVFVLVTNDKTRVHDALISRCADGGYAFDALRAGKIKTRLQEICESEDVQLSEDRLTSIAAFANGDMRAALTRLQKELARGERVDIGDADLASAANTFTTESQ